MSLRRADSTAHVQMNSVHKESIDQYFNLLEETMLAHKTSKVQIRFTIWMRQEYPSLLKCQILLQNMDKRKYVTGHQVKRNKLPQLPEQMQQVKPFFQW